MFISFGTNSVVLLLDDASYEILASLAHNWLAWKCECTLVALLNCQTGSAGKFILRLTRMFNFVCCLPPSSAKKGVWP